ncbi:MAG: AcrB/AcrD/AcrF family protein, partial [Candidatus Omnitrophica bacterium]|nr:AcrB/AcrD/AcrF family protein [Candidatus Omnitrophota bacterium]
MNITELSLKNKRSVAIISVLVLLGGMAAYSVLGKLREPTYSITTSLVVTRYPGASPVEVEEQVTAVLERHIQHMGSLKNVKSETRAGISTIYVNVKGFYSGERLKQVWTNLRERVRDARGLLPPGAETPVVIDHFGRTYGVFLALAGEGFTYPELKEYARYAQKRLKLCEDVAGVTLFGLQRETVTVEVSRQKLAEAGISPASFMRALEERNKVVRTGRLTSGGEKIQIYQTGSFRSLKDIEDLVIRGENSDQLVRLQDIADVRLTTVDPPDPIMRFNMERAIGIGISTVAGGNTIVMGDSVKAEIRKLMKELPAGLKIHIVNFQSTAVKTAINRFITGLMQSILIVVAVLVIFLGFRSSLVIVNGLLFNIAALFIIMRMFGVNLQNVSIAALILALGMMVDDSVVISDNILVKLREGKMDRDTAGVQSAKATGFAQFIATFIIIASFLPIYLAESATGVFCESLFLVVAIALSVSWFQAMTVVPVIGGYLFKVKEKGKETFSSPLYNIYRGILKIGLRHRWMVIGLMVALLVLANLCFGFIKQDFFPLADRAQFQVNYWNPQGTGIVKTSEDLKVIEKHILSLEGVNSLAVSAGSGPPRFLLGFTPEQPNPSYGCLIVNTRSTDDVPVLVDKVRKYLKTNFPQANPVVSGFPMGGAPSMKIEARFFGPDPGVLRKLADQAKDIMREKGGVDIRDNWRQKVKAWRPEYIQSRGVMTGITPRDIGRSLLTFT